MSRKTLLACVVLDDVHDLDVRGDLIKLRSAHQSRLEVVEIDVKVSGSGGIVLLGGLGGGRRLLSVDADHLSLFDEAAGTVNTFAIDKDVAVVDDLLGSKDGGGKTGVVHQSVKTLGEETEELLVSLTDAALGFGVSDLELLLADGVVVAELLLLKLQFTIGGKFDAFAFSVGSGSVGTLHARTFGVTPETFTDTTTEFVLCSTCGWHNQSLSYFC